MFSYTLVVTGFKDNLDGDTIRDELHAIFSRIHGRFGLSVEGARAYVEFNSEKKGKQALRFNGSVTDIGTLNIIPEYYLLSVHVNPNQYDEDRKIQRLI